MILIFTAFAFLIIVIKCTEIISMETKESNAEYDWNYTKSDYDYVYWNVSMLPSFCSAMMNLYEGNQQLLNLYAEIEKPKDFFKLITMIFTVLSLTVVMGVGLLGYLTFGDRIESLIIYNLPTNDNVSIMAKAFYIATIAGSFVLVIQPLFHLVETSQWYKIVNEWLHNALSSPSADPSDDLDDLLENVGQQPPAVPALSVEEIPQDEEDAREEKKVPESSLLFYTIRMAVVAILIFLSLSASSSMTVLLTLGGSLFGTIVTILLPVMFYNKAWSQSSYPSIYSHRSYLIIVNYFVLVLGTIVGAIGFWGAL